MKNKTINNPLWSEGEDKNFGKIAVEYAAEQDVILDKAFVQYECLVNQAHQLMLLKQNILPINQVKKILEVLEEIKKLDKEGEFDLKKELEALTGDTAKQEEILQHDMQIKQDNIKNLQAKLAELQTQRTVAFNNVQPEWQTQYQRMQHSVPDPIVPAIHASCSACYYAIPFPDMSKLKKGEIVPGRSC